MNMHLIVFVKLMSIAWVGEQENHFIVTMTSQKAIYSRYNTEAGQHGHCKYYIMLLDISRQLACMKLGSRENISLCSTAGFIQAGC